MSITEKPKRLVLSREAIGRRVQELAARISADYRGQDLVLVGILKGAFIFLADLVRALDFPVEVDFVRLFSYGAGTVSSGEIRLTKDVELSLKDRHVLIVEDIVDAGLTLDFLRRHLAAFQPRSLKICCLIDKLERRQVDVPLDYVGFTIQRLPGGLRPGLRRKAAHPAGDLCHRKGLNSVASIQ